MKPLLNPPIPPSLIATDLVAGKELWAYLNLVTRQGYGLWLFYILLIRLIDKQAKFMVIKHGNETVGGFIVTSLRMVKYKPYNLFKPKLWKMINALANKGYHCLCCFLIKDDFRNKGLGTDALRNYFRNYGTKLYFTSSAGAVNFYLRNGAYKIFTSRNSVFALDEIMPK